MDRQALLRELEASRGSSPGEYGLLFHAASQQGQADDAFAGASYADKAALRSDVKRESVQKLFRRLNHLENQFSSNTMAYTGHARWMIPYADLLTVLLGLFLMILSLAMTDNQQLQNTVANVKQLLHQKEVVQKTPKTETKPVTTQSLPQLQAQLEATVFTAGLPMAASQAEKEAQKEQLMKEIQISQEARGLVITLLDSVLFPPGTSELTPAAKKTLDRVAVVLKKVDRPIQVEGHTDNTPIKTSVYPSNWELSMARAMTIVRFLIETHHFNPARLSAAGYGEYHPMAPNSSIGGKQKNRRVDIIVMDPLMN